jgi:hypothetical protein
MLAENWLPFSRWNLRYNPFGELTAAERAGVAVFDPEPVLSELGKGLVAIQFIGDCGRGKTTRLLAIERRLPPRRVPERRLPERRPSGLLCLPPLAAVNPVWWGRALRTEGDPVMIDEAQRIPLPVRMAIFRRRVPLVLGTHRDFSRELRPFGYRVTTVRVGPQNDARHVAEVANARIAAARLKPTASVPVLSIGDAEALVARFGDDLRAIETFLYNRVQQQVGRDEQMRFVD